MLVIVDGGSTKADWEIVESPEKRYLVSTCGFNPFFWTSDNIVEELQKEFVNKVPVNEKGQVFFYGSGCSDELRCNIIADALKVIFPNSEISVDHDLMACARATAGDQPAITCILGTGSNSCAFDGENITDHLTNMGHLVGDEGSGTWLGKMLLRGYFYREMPADIKAEFQKAYPIGEREILNKLYESGKSNVYLASFAKFMSDHKDHMYIRKLVQDGFSEFIKRNIRKYENHNTLPIHFVGSIAYHFKDILKMALEERGLTLGIVVQKPIDNLVNYHLNADKRGQLIYEKRN